MAKEICYLCGMPIEGTKVISKYTGMCYHSECHHTNDKECDDEQQKEQE